jgi:hypothetical protein
MKFFCTSDIHGRFNDWGVCSNGTETPINTYITKVTMDSLKILNTSPLI